MATPASSLAISDASALPCISSTNCSIRRATAAGTLTVGRHDSRSVCGLVHWGDQDPRDGVRNGNCRNAWPRAK
jgi:hypothetical protein